MTTSRVEDGRPPFWPIQVAAWVAYGLISTLGALPYRRAYPVVLYFTGTTAAAFLASFVMWLLCRCLMARRWSWSGAVAAMLACSYALGVISSMCGASLELLAGHSAVAPDWRAVAIAGLANAFSPAIMLVAWGAFYWSARHRQEVRLREQQLIVAKSAARDAELKALRYQITPHFLFNTLNGISTLVGEGDTRSARRMIALLANFLRSTLEPAAQGDVRVADELTQVRQYLEIEQVRLGRRMVASIRCDDASKDALVPHLLLQPLIENAVRHGIAPSMQEGKLSLEVRSHHDSVIISVYNSLHAQQHAIRESAGLGLAMTRARLAARYRDFRFAASADAPGGWLAVIQIPLVTG